MTDIVNRATRSRMMSGIKCKNTNPEVSIRRHLHKRGFRYSLHSSKLPGKPDIFLRKYNAVIFVHGCFWHGHNCRLFKWPKSRPEFWRNKIEYNKLNDEKVIKLLKIQNLRICIIWECAIKGSKKDLFPIIKRVISWIAGKQTFLEIK